jgi:hypothetical protein
LVHGALILERGTRIGTLYKLDVTPCMSGSGNNYMHPWEMLNILSLLSMTTLGNPRYFIRRKNDALEDFKNIVALIGRKNIKNCKDMK